MIRHKSKLRIRSRCAFEAEIDMSRFGKVTAKQKAAILSEVERLLHLMQDAHSVAQRYVGMDLARQVDAYLARARGQKPKAVIRFPFSPSQAKRLGTKLSGFCVAAKPMLSK